MTIDLLRAGRRGRPIADGVGAGVPHFTAYWPPSRGTGRRGGFSAGKILLCLGLALAALLPYRPADAQGDQLGPTDKVQIRVVEWRAGRGEYFEWTAIGGQYTVASSGSLLLPLIGEVRAQGRTAAELAGTIAAELQARVGLINRPNASVEIVQFRPIYVTGDVERPGEYPFRPGLNVLQGVSLAGGPYRPNEAGLLRLERDQITATGSYESARLERRRLLVRRNRIEAEMAGGTEIKIPGELRDDPDVDRLVASERAIMAARTEALRSRITALTELQRLLTAEIASLSLKIETQRRQIEIARRELKDVGSLRELGLVVTARISNLERTAADLEGRLIDYETAILRARQEINKAERDALDVRTERQAKLTTELQQAQADLDQVSAKLTTARSLINEAGVTAPHLALEQWTRAAQRPAYSILRSSDGRSAEIPADETTLLRPGDVVRIVQDSPRAAASHQSRPRQADSSAGSRAPAGESRF